MTDRFTGPVWFQHDCHKQGVHAPKTDVKPWGWDPSEKRAYAGALKLGA